MPIASRPFDLRGFLDRRAAALGALADEAGRAAALVDRHAADGGRLLESLLRYGGADAEAAFDAANMEHVARTLDRRLPLRRLRDDLGAVREHGMDLLRHAVATAERAEPLHPRHLAALACLDGAEAGAAEYGYRPDDPANADDPEYAAAMALLGGLRALADVVARGRPLVDDTAARLRALADARRGLADDRGWRPPHEEVETLWHASAYAAEIARDGFRPSAPEGRRGLGNYGRVEEVSLTHDPELAHDIARCLRELWMVANGRLGARDIVGWIRAEGIDARSDVARCVGLGKPLDALATPDEAARLYWAYLGLSAERNNPVFAHVEETARALRGRPLDAIGVVECRVRLEPGDEYMAAESEFRVAPGRVLSARLADAPAPAPWDAPSRRA